MPTIKELLEETNRASDMDKFDTIGDVSCIYKRSGIDALRKLTALVPELMEELHRFISNARVSESMELETEYSYAPTEAVSKAKNMFPIPQILIHAKYLVKEIEES